MQWTCKQKLAGAALTAVFIIAWTVVFAGSLVDWVEIETGRGGSIEFSLRVYFAYAFSLALILLTFSLVHFRYRDGRLRFVLAALVLQCFVLIAIWLFDRIEFAGEESATRFFTALALIGAAAVALMNAGTGRLTGPRHRLASAFWSVIGAAFLAGGMDEYFAIHEWVGRTLAPITQQAGLPRQLFQDGITVSYAIGAILFVVVFLTPFRREMLQRGQFAGWLLISGILVYGLAVANDTLDFVAEGLFPLSSPKYAMNFAEEVLELTAAVLFFCACSIALYERQPDVFGPSASASARRLTNKRYALFAFVPVFLTCLLLPFVLRVTLPADPYTYSSQDRFTMTVWADATDGLDGVDELLYVPGLGLLAGNEGTGEVLLFNDSGSSRSFIAGLASPDGLAHSGESFYVTDDIAGEVREYSLTGEPRRVSANWLSPEGVVVDDVGNVYVADLEMGLVARLEKLTSVPIVTRLDGLRSPEQLAVDDNGNLYVADERAKAILVRAQDSTIRLFADATDGIGIPETLRVHDGKLYVVDSERSSIHRFDLDGNGSGYIVFAKRHDLSGIAFDASGNIFIAITSEVRSKNVILRFGREDFYTSN